MDSIGACGRNEAFARRDADKGGGRKWRLGPFRDELKLCLAGKVEETETLKYMSV